MANPGTSPFSKLIPGRIKRGDWSAVNFLSPFLVEAYRTLTEASFGVVPMVPMSDLADIGPAGTEDSRRIYPFGHAHPIWSSSALVSQDRCYAVDARGNRRLDRAERSEATSR